MSGVAIGKHHDVRRGFGHQRLQKVINFGAIIVPGKG
jgi:hypothetical protein